AGFTMRNPAQCCPHHLLECGSLNVQRNLGWTGRSLKQLQNLFCRRAQPTIVPADIRGPELAAKVAGKLGIAGPEPDRAEAARSSSYQEFPQIGGQNRVADFSSVAIAPEL